MSIEYHGWIALATSHGDWSDDDFENGVEQVARAIAYLRPNAGHEPILPDCNVLPRVLYLKGNEVESLDAVLRAIEQVGAVFDGAYGELAVFEETSPSSRRDSSVVTRYSVADGRLSHGRRGDK
jgi:hypothetical protein